MFTRFFAKNTMAREKNEILKFGDGDDIISSQVLEYYANYSQNRKLSTYFCGESTAVKEKIPINIVYTSDYEDGPENIKSAVENKWGGPSVLITDNADDVATEKSRVLSPASSVASNRKLEWDSGADIGYGNCQSHNFIQKSTSLPILSNVKGAAGQENILRRDSSQMKCIALAINSSDELGYVEKSHDNNSIKSANKSADISDCLDNRKVTKLLKQKIGVPLAESTPANRAGDRQCDSNVLRRCTGTVTIRRDNKKTAKAQPVRENVVILDMKNVDRTKKCFVLPKSSSCETLSSGHKADEHVKMWSSQHDLTLEVNCKDLAKHKYTKTAKLSISKPLSVHCVGGVSICLEKCIQTSLTRKSSVAVQTGDDFDLKEVSKMVKCSSPQERATQRVIYLQYSDTDKNLESCGTQTSSDISNCNSFEYLVGDDLKRSTENVPKALYKKETPSDTNTSSSPKRNENTIDRVKLYLANNCDKSESTSGNLGTGPGVSSSTFSTNSSKCRPLGELLAVKQSNHLITDIEKSIQLLERLRKSRKYDNVTKKFYVKKIVEKIVNCKYTDDSSGTYDELQHGKMGSTEISRSTTESAVHEKLKQQNQRYLLNNLPWVPAVSPEKDKKQLLRSQTFSCALLPRPNNNGADSKKTKLQRNPRFTITDNDGPLNTISKDSSSTRSSRYDKPTSSLSSSSYNTTSSEKQTESKKSWREDKTLSEQIVEGKESRGSEDKNIGENKPLSERESHDFEHKRIGDFSNGDNDDLLRYAKRERGHQITWINNEISYLNKLRSLLERKSNSKKDEMMHLEKPRIPDMKGVQQHTSVYMITTQNMGTKRKCEGNEGNLRRVNSEYTTAPNSIASITHANGATLQDYVVQFNDKNEDLNHRLFALADQDVFEDVSTRSGRKASTKQYINKQRAMMSNNVDGYQYHNAAPFVSSTVRTNLQGLQNDEEYTSFVPRDVDPAEVRPQQSVSAYTARAPVSLASSKTYPNDLQRRGYTFPRNTATFPANMCGPSSRRGQELQPQDVMKMETLIRPQTAPQFAVKQERYFGDNKSKSTSGTLKSYTSDGRGKASIRRYTFEIPIDKNGTPRFQSSSRNKVENFARHGIQNETETEKVQFQIDDKKIRIAGETNSFNDYGRNEGQTKDNCIGVRKPKADKQSSPISVDDHFKDSACQIDRSFFTKQKGVGQTCKDICTGFQEFGDQVDLLPAHPEQGQSRNEVGKVNRLDAKEAPISLNDKDTQTTVSLSEVSKQNSPEFSSNSTSSTVVTASSSVSAICACCKRKNMDSKTLKFSDELDKTCNESHVLCHPCYKQNTHNRTSGKPYFSSPGYVCNCYTLVKKGTVQQIRKTVEDLDKLDEVYCSCTVKKGKGNRKYCSQCKCKMKDKHCSKIQPVAYTLTFEHGEPELELKRDLKCGRRSLEEIKIKIPLPRSRKSGDKSYPGKENDEKRRSLQDYLYANRRDFVESSEHRRKCMIDLAYMREQRCQKYKQLLALTDGIPLQSTCVDIQPKRLFSSKTMKEITARNYKKLSDVQQKLLDVREKQIKKANRILTDIFNKKLQENVLRGKHSLPTNVSVIQFV